MKTTVVIDEKLLKEAMEVAKVKTKKAAIEKGLQELIRSRNRDKLRQELGTFDISLTLEELERLRSES